LESDGTHCIGVPGAIPNFQPSMRASLIMPPLEPKLEPTGTALRYQVSNCAKTRT